MNDFNLIQKLNSPQPERVVESTIQYQTYEIEVNDSATMVKIPLRETEHFEEEVSALTEKITSPQMKRLLRKYRGIRGTT